MRASPVERQLHQGRWQADLAQRVAELQGIGTGKGWNGTNRLEHARLRPGAGQQQNPPLHFRLQQQPPVRPHTAAVAAGVPMSAGCVLGLRACKSRWLGGRQGSVRGRPRAGACRKAAERVGIAATTPRT